MGAAVKGALARGLSAGNKRLRIPDAKPQQVFACANNGDGSFTSVWVAAMANTLAGAAWGDMDGDGMLDFANGNSETTYEVISSRME